MGIEENQTIPKGYKKTELGIIPEDWEIKKFDDIFHKIPSKNFQIQSKEYLDLGKFPVIDQGKSRIIACSDNLKKVFNTPKVGVIIFGDHTREIKFIDFDFIIGADGTQILLVENYYGTKFFYYLLKIKKIPNTGYNRHFKFLKELYFGYPHSFAEQTAIAVVLSDIDKLIDNLDKLIDKKKFIKQGAMQELLTGKRRLPGFSGDWEVKKLGEITNIKTGGRNNKDKVEGGEYPFFVRSATVERINSYSHDCEAILVPGEGGIGSIFHYIHGQFDVHQRVYAITQFAPTVSSKYVYLYMTLHFGVHAIQNSVKATVDSLRLPTFQEFQISLPSILEEQTAIASVLSDIDAEIEALEQKRDKYKQIKQGAMQVLLTGKIRLI